MFKFIRLLSVLFVFGCFFSVGYWVSRSTEKFPGGSEYVMQTSSTRNPAAIQKNYDFSQLEGSALNFAAKQRLLDGVKVVRENKDLGIELGHFVIRSENGDKVFACQRYGKVILSFQGDGVATSGEPPSMEVEGDCVMVGSDVNRIAAIWVPVQRILGEPAADGDFDFNDAHPSHVKFANVSDDWPRLWRLKTLRLVDPSGAHEAVTVPEEEVKKMMRQPLILEF